MHQLSLLEQLVYCLLFIADITIIKLAYLVAATQPDALQA
jgi:hypothetical protein